uniref:A-kinase anchor protein 2 C-terminal domain-containing protein n=1 Tax=Electrophorus electricus TaxID=8005 RepID=A0A4W4DZK5_ELEEL
MEFEAHSESQHNHTPNGQTGVKHRGETLDSEVAQEIRYLDEVLEANCCDPGAEMTSNGTCSHELQAINLDGTGPSVCDFDVSASVNQEVAVEGEKQTTYFEDSLNNTKPNGHSGMMNDNCNRSPEKGTTTIKKEAQFELRAFHEDRKPSKLFDMPKEKEVRVKKVRPSEEIVELERERLELIRDQAVKKNPGIAAKWWNPPQEKVLEDELEPEQLESLRRYEERKQRRPEANQVPQSSSQQIISFVHTNMGNKDDIVVQGIDFSAARQQFLHTEHSKQHQPQQATKRSVAPQIYSAKPFSRASDVDRATTASHIIASMEDRGEMNHVKTERVSCSSGDSPTNTKADSEVQNDDFTCAQAVMTILKDEDSELYQRSMNSLYHPEEIDSGLDDLSLRSQDTTMLETLSNDFSMDNISESGASKETMSAFLENSLGDCSFPSTPMATTPIIRNLEISTNSPVEQNSSFQGDSLTEEELEYHAGILVQNAIQQAIAHQNDKWEPLQAMCQSSPFQDSHMENFKPTQATPEEKWPKMSPPKEPTPAEEKKAIAPKITIDVPSVQATTVIPANTYRPPSLSSSPSEKPEFSYFRKYSEAAELRSTASVTCGQDMEVTSGPFRLRSRKQRTLSMIEEEIRAAQEREEELRRERLVQSSRPNPNPIHKQKSNSLPSKLVLSAKTVPGKIEKIRTIPPVSPASSEGALPSPLSDLGSDDSGGSQRPKNFMQTLMEDYETHKVKRREKAEDNCVLEATRVTRRKSNMALRWEAGIYANQEEDEEEEE